MLPRASRMDRPKPSKNHRLDSAANSWTNSWVDKCSKWTDSIGDWDKSRQIGKGKWRNRCYLALCLWGFELLSLTAFAYPRYATSRQLLRPEAPPRVEIHHDVYRISWLNLWFMTDDLASIHLSHWSLTFIPSVSIRSVTFRAPLMPSSNSVSCVRIWPTNRFIRSLSCYPAGF